MNIAHPETSKQIHLLLVTCRDVFQYAARQKGEASSDYEQRSTLLRLSPEDMKVLGVKDGERVKLSNQIAELVVRVKTEKSCWQGVGFIPASPYVNRLTSYDPVKRRLPDFKRLEVVAETLVAER